MGTTKKPATLMAAIRYFDQDTASRYVESIKWPDGPVCPQCGSINVGFIKSRGRHQCREKGCRRQFSLTTGTIFESTHLRLDQWMVAVWMIVNCRNGVSSCEIARTIGCKQQSAWHLLHRVRHVMEPNHDDLMSGTVEADATLVGGLVKNMPMKRRANRTRDPRCGKITVHALKERDSGMVRAAVIEREDTKSIRSILGENVATGSQLYTDAAHAYTWTRNEGYSHASVNHTKQEYMRGPVGTNGCENFFSCLRRSLKGTYIRPTGGHLQAYVDEAAFRFNVRYQSEWERFEAAMKHIVGKRLSYKKLTGGAKR